VLKPDDKQSIIVDIVLRIATQKIAARSAELSDTAGSPERSIDVFVEQGLTNPTFL